MDWMQKNEWLGTVISEHLGNKNFYEHSLDPEVTQNRYSLEEDINTLEVIDYSDLQMNEDDDDGENVFGPTLTNSFISEIELGDLKNLLLNIREYMSVMDCNCDDDDWTCDVFGPKDQLMSELKSLCRIIERFSFSGEYCLPLRETNQFRNARTTY